MPVTLHHYRASKNEILYAVSCNRIGSRDKQFVWQIIWSRSRVAYCNETFATPNASLSLLCKKYLTFFWGHLNIKETHHHAYMSWMICWGFCRISSQLMICKTWRGSSYIRCLIYYIRGLMNFKCWMCSIQKGMPKIINDSGTNAYLLVFSWV